MREYEGVVASVVGMGVAGLVAGAQVAAAKRETRHAQQVAIVYAQRAGAARGAAAVLSARVQQLETELDEDREWQEHLAWQAHLKRTEAA